VLVLPQLSGHHDRPHIRLGCTRSNQEWLGDLQGWIESFHRSRSRPRACGFVVFDFASFFCAFLLLKVFCAFNIYPITTSHSTWKLLCEPSHIPKTFSHTGLEQHCTHELCETALKYRKHLREPVFDCTAARKRLVGVLPIFLDSARHLSIAKHRTLIVELYLKVTPISELPATWSQSHYAVSLAGHVAICLS
jgi:hypothetical protein